MADVVLSTDELTVLGGPSSVDVEVDFGPAGQRGSLIFASTGNPNNPNSGIPDGVLPNDLAIDVSTTSESYLAVYQYISADGIQSWKELARISPNAGSLNATLTFDTSGQAQLSALVSLFTDDTNVTPANFNIQYAIEQDETQLNFKPIASSFNISNSFTVFEEQNYLTGLINAVEYDISTQTWAPVTGSRIVHLFVTVV